MKNLLVISLTILFSSCSTDDFTSSEMHINQEKAVMDSYSGLKEDVKEEGLSRKIKVGNHILVVSERIANQVVSLINHGQLNVSSSKFDEQTVSYDTIVMETAPVEALFVIVEESILGLPLKENVKSYIVNLNDLKGQDYGVIDEYIIEYEIAKRADSSLSGDEKNTILSISSVSEASLYSEKERKDRDWETSTTSKQKL